jgi:transcriptional regulator with XRE-family HTH domain
MTIKELRTKEGLSQSALAKKLGIATSAIGHMENGRMKVSAKIAEKAKEVYGVVIDTEAKVEKAAKATAKKTKTAAQKAEKAVKKAPAKVKAAEKKVEDKVVADKIEAKKAVAKTTRKTKTAVKKAATKVEKAVEKPAAKARAAKLTIEIQSPLGGSITPEEIAAKLPKDTTNVYVRIDENKLYWVKKNGETGSVDIWD